MRRISRWFFSLLIRWTILSDGVFLHGIPATISICLKKEDALRFCRRRVFPRKSASVLLWSVSGFGISPELCLIDYGGHRGEEVKEFCNLNPRAFMQKGTNIHQRNFYPSSSVKKLFMVSAKYYQRQALEALWSRSDRSCGFLYLAKDLSDECISELRDITQDNSSKWGDKFENWKPKTGNDHSFACLRYAYVIMDIARSSLKDDKFRQNKAPSLRNRKRLQK